ncbi:uncharacterized protein BXZ73DRAFT_53124 [Epithele typhae]|uniref:uncharacterized protein n=1 Tax=Epithele typhae TaxID=378194 RepID=UPI002007DCCC|nr:uncharacterized protein BXZ73DRAFT_53124 [Epithele typhae]KAH9918211.1 hypothetical protein BXZ73DRAFT_53124 [Epithele typhae]
MFTTTALLSCLHALVLHGALARTTSPMLVQPQAPWTAGDPVKVPVILGVMSACPDAILCETVFDRVLARAAGKMDLQLTFVGTPDASVPDWGVDCKHGALECAGNVQELCAIAHAPFEQWWNFVHCQNFEGRYQVGRPETALKCAKAAGLDWENGGVGACAGASGDGKGEEGVRLLRESVRQTAAMGIEKSCTVMINGKQVCVRDGEWRECEQGHTSEDFVRQIEAEYNKLNAM